MLSLRSISSQITKSSLVLASAAVLGFFPSMASGQEFSTTAPHAIIMDAQTGAILFEKDAALPMAPASMTKIMTASLVFDSIRDGSITAETKFRVSEEAWRRGGVKSGSSTMFLDVGSEVSVGDLLRGVIIQSGNDACIVLAEGIAGSETAFAEMMTQRARELGLESATFRNATGWPAEGHEISARDLATLSRYTITQYPEFYDLYGQRSFTWNGIKQSNRNPLLGKFTGADGLKTGHTEISKYGLVGSAKRGEERRIIVVNGLESNSERSTESIRVMEAAFNLFKIYRLYEDGAVTGQADVFMGKSDSVDLITSGPVIASLYRPSRKKMKARIEYDGPVAAPIAAGDQIARLIVTVPGAEDMEYELLAANNVPRKGLFARAAASLKIKFGN